MKRSLSVVLALLFLSTAFLSACGEPSREEYRDMAAEEVCDEAERCNSLGSTSYGDCIIEQRARFNDFWPSSQCSDGRISEERYNRCMNRARTAACDGNFFDQLSAASDCRASQVCVN